MVRQNQEHMFIVSKKEMFMIELAGFSSPSFYENPYPFYQKLRTAGNIVKISSGVFISGTYSITKSILNHKSMGRSFITRAGQRYGDDKLSSKIFDTFADSLLFLNPPDHTQLHASMTQAFNHSQYELFRQRAQEAAERFNRFIRARRRL
jgi:cytochrome P450